MNLMIVPGMLVCSSFLISVGMFIVPKALLISLNPFATVLFDMCSAITVKCCIFVTVLRWCVMYVVFYVCIVTCGAVAARVWEV